MKVYYITADCGDGSSTVEFYRNKETAQKLVDDDEEMNNETYFGNEGMVQEFKIPDGPNTIRFRD